MPSVNSGRLGALRHTHPRSRLLGLRLLGIALLIVLLVRVNICQLGAILSKANLWLVGFVVLLNLPQLGAKALRWSFLLGMQGVTYPVKDAVLAYFASFYVGIFTPGRLGELIKAFYVQQKVDELNRPALSLGEAMASVILDRVFDLYALIIAGIVGLWSFTHLVRLPSWVFVLMCGSVLLSLVALWPPVGQWGLRVLAKWVEAARISLLDKLNLTHLIQRLIAQIEGFYAQLEKLAQLKILYTIGLTLVGHTLFYTQCYLLVLALDLSFGLPPSASYVFISFAMALVNLVNLLPISISGLGTREAILGILFGSVELPPSAAVAYSILVLLTFYVGAAGIGAMAWAVAPLDPRFTQSRREENGA